jgi:hypothetical protein
MTTKPVALTDIRAAIVREIGLRRAVYPGRVEAGKMKHEKAEHEVAAMESALRVFDATVAIATAAQGLRDTGRDPLRAARIAAKPKRNRARSYSSRVEMLDAALAQFDRYKVEPPASTNSEPEARHA